MKSFSKILLLALVLVAFFSCSKNEDLSSIDDSIQKREARPAPVEGDLLCGTEDSDIPLPLSPREIQDLANQELASPLEPINIEIKYHIVRTDAGTDGVPESDLETITDNINEGFDVVLYGILNFVMAPDRLNFINSEVNYIDNSTYHLTSSSEFAALMAIDNDPDKINIYIVKELTNAAGNQIGGRAFLNGNALATNRYNNTYLGSSPAHEVGHNLGLRHTHQSSAGLCLTNDNYSNTTGDEIYDTPLDYSMSQLVNSACGYTGSQVTSCGEPLGPFVSDPHNVLISNIMSYSRHSCRIGFSGTQHLQMNAQAINSGLGDVGYPVETY